MRRKFVVAASTLWLLLSALHAQVPQMINYQGRVIVGSANFNGTGQFKFALVNGGTNTSVQATATATVTSGFLTSIAVTNAGAGYTSAPAVTITDTTGSGASATANVSGGSVTSITVNSAGSGYSATPTVSIASPPANLVYVTYWSNDGTSSGGNQPTNAISINVSGGLYSVLLGDTSLTNMTAIPNGVFDNPDVRLRVWFNDGSHGSQQLTPDQRVAAVGYAAIAANVPNGAITSAKIANGAVGGSQIANGAVGANQLAPGAGLTNLNSSGEAGIPSGGTILSSSYNDTNLLGAGYVKVGKVQLDDTWELRAGGAAPIGRFEHTAVWTGSEMIIWGGYNAGVQYNGARYNPASNSWSAVTSTGAPVGRYVHTAVWTGTEMIVWGGYGIANPLNDGGRYNPASDTWILLPTSGAPAARYNQTAVWTGTEMIIWGGSSTGVNGTPKFGDGGRFNPTTNAWTAIPNSLANTPSARAGHTAVWSGSEMIIWGGDDGFNFSVGGGRYNPAANTWVATQTTGAPTARSLHAAVWTGTEMIVWSGYGAGNDGGRYNPAANSWTATSITGAPSTRFWHTAVWTGTEMIVWGGENNLGAQYFNNGGRYNPATDAWVPVTTSGAPPARYLHTAVWTGHEMIIWGGGVPGVPFGDGSRYTPGLDSWVAITNAPAPRFYQQAVWTGSEMIAWGGFGGSNDGGRYNPANNSWTPTNTTGAPSTRFNHSSVWTGTEMIVWGGTDNTNYFNDGGRYNPVTDSWTLTQTSGAPFQRRYHTAVWSGSEMIVWGGSYFDGTNTNYLNNGSRYNPSSNTWAGLPAGAPSARANHTAVWTGTEMIVWGGWNGTTFFNDGGRYNVGANTWSATPAVTLSGRNNHTVVWTGTEMIVWGGQGSVGPFGDGARFNPAANSWATVTTTNAPAAREFHTAVWTGTEMIIWGGAYFIYFNDGGRYNPSTDNWTPTQTAGAPPPRYEHVAVWTGVDMIIFGGSSPPTVVNETYRYVPGRMLYLYAKP
jgi:N-acetylneuraminic acid mutarotase